MAEALELYVFNQYTLWLAMTMRPDFGGEDEALNTQCRFMKGGVTHVE